MFLKSRIYELNLFRKEINHEYSLKFCKYKLSFNLDKNEIMRYVIKKPDWNDVLGTGNTIYALYSNSYAILTYYIFKLKQKAFGQYYYEDTEKNLDKKFYTHSNNFFSKGLELLLRYDVQYEYRFGDTDISIVYHGVYGD